MRGAILLKKAGAALRNQGLKLKRLHAMHEMDMVYSGLGELTGAGVGAVVDIKAGENGGQAKWGPVPINALVGLVPVGTAILVKPLGRLRGPLAALGFGLIGVGGYRFILDKHAESVANNPPAQ